jgi:Mrp family chromosome partitioning ATPase
MQRLVKRLQEKFDLIIYDTPALDGLTDLNFLAALTDGILMVVGVNKTKRSRFNKGLEGLKTYRIPIVGVVANHTKGGGYASYPVAQPTGAPTGEMPSAFFGNLKGASDGTPTGNHQVH